MISANTTPSVLRITHRRRIWRITLDDVFYGDYRSHRHATESAEAAAATLRTQGRKVTILAAEAQP